MPTRLRCGCRAPRKGEKVKEAGEQVKAVAGLVGFLFDESLPRGSFIISHKLFMILINY